LVEEIRKVSIIGAGLMGHGIAQVFASHGMQVCLSDIKKELLVKALKQIKSNLNLMVNKGIGRKSDIAQIISRIRTTTEIDETAGGQLIIEAVFENLELKQEVIQKLDSICPVETIITSNTSVISITEIAAKAKHRERIVGTHFWNPPYLIPLVEVVKAKDTSDQVMESTYQVLKEVGKHPVKVFKDVPGFLANRLQHALWREAISIVENGIADAATVDEAIKNGFGLRLPILGPMENADMVGLDLTLSIHDYILKDLEASPYPSKLLREKVNKGELGFKTGHGFQAWSPKQIEKSRENLLNYLIEWTRREQLIIQGK
jgi:3-hydroxybutyryl-CoA dehydrogenase